MELSVAKEDKKAIITISGRVSSNDSPALQACIDENIAGIEELVLDLEKMTYISSSGLRVFLQARKSMMEQGSMKVVNVQSDVMDIFDMTGFTGFLDLES